MLILCYLITAPSSGSLVDASGYKFAEKDTKPGKIRLKKSVKLGKKKGDGVFTPFLLGFHLDLRGVGARAVGCICANSLTA